MPKIDGLELTVTLTVSKDYHSWEAVLKSRYASDANDKATLFSRIDAGEGADVLSDLEVRSAGVAMAATVHVTEFVTEGDCAYEVGFVQIVEAEQSQAIYAGKWVRKQTLPTLPCYDSTDDGCIPWYTPAGEHDGITSHQPITGTGQIKVELKDYPHDAVDPYANRGGGMRCCR
jgi:hypothetical protein